MTVVRLSCAAKEACIDSSPGPDAGRCPCPRGKAQDTVFSWSSRTEGISLSNFDENSTALPKRITLTALPIINWRVSMKDFPKLATAEDCRQLAEQLKKQQKIIALWATTIPRSSVDILLHFRRMLQKRGYFCLFLLKSNAVETFLRLSTPEDRDDFIYIFDRAILLEHCSFIDILFSHDYCCGPDALTFKGKLYYFQHNIFSAGPLPLRDLYADGLITPSYTHNKLDYSIFPNSLKREFTKDIKIIPAGYPKIDILMEAASHHKPPFKRVTYYPIMLNDFTRRNILSDMFLLLRDFLTQFFTVFPDWEFILRPFPPDRESSFFQDISKEFSQKNFILDTGEDNVTNLVSCDLFITDYSSSYLNYAYTTLRPTLFLQPDHGKPLYKDFGYIAQTANEAISALKQALNSLPQWENKLRKLRECHLCHPGQALGYLCDRIESLLQGRMEKDWISLPKQDTPYTTTSAWLRLFSLPIMEKSQFFFPSFLQEANKLCGQDNRIALAALRAYIRAWHYPPHYSNHWIQLQEKTEEALAQTPADWALALLRFLNKKVEMQDITLYFLAYALHTIYKNSPDYKNEIQEYLRQTLPLQLCTTICSRVIELMLCYDMNREAIKALSKIKNTHEISTKTRVAFAMLHIQQGNRQFVHNLLQQWKNDKVQHDTFGIPLLLRIMQLSQDGVPLPSFFLPNKKNLQKIILYNVPVYFYDIRHARQCLDPLFPLFLKEARADVTLWAQTLATARLCRRGDVVALCAWEMFKVRRLSPKLLHELESEGFGPQLIELRRVLDRFARTHNSHGPVQ